MRKQLINLLLSFPFLLVMAVPAMAYNGEFYTWGGYHEITDTFQSVALIFADSNYNAIFGVMLIMGITGGIVRGLTSSRPNGPGLFSWVLPVIIGVALFKGFIEPKGQLYIYDPVHNETGFVTGLPDGVVMLASAFNSVEQNMVNIISNAGPVDYNSMAGGIGFDIMQSLPNNIILNDQYVQGSITRFIQDCVVPEIQDPTYSPPITANNLRTNDDFIALFQAAANPAMYTVFIQDKDGTCPGSTDPNFPETYRGAGCAETCAQAYADITAVVTDPTQYTNGIAGMCAASGFDVTSQAELTQCQTIITNSVNWILTASYSFQNIAQQNAVAMALNVAVTTLSQEGATGLLATRSAGVNMTAIGQQANRWIPTLRAVTLAVMISLIPFLVCFLVTPFSGAVLKLITGFFFVTTVWGVLDAGIHNLAMNAALRAMAEIAQYKLGYFAMMNYSLESQKATALYGQIRLEGFLFSTVIAGAFGFTATSAFSHFIMGLQGAIGQGAAGAAQTVTTPAGRGQFERANIEGGVTNEMVSQPGGAEMFRQATKLAMERRMKADPYFDQQAMNRVQDNLVSGLDAQMSGKALSGADRQQAGGVQGAQDRLKALQSAGILGPQAGLEQLAQFEGHTGQGGDEKGQHGYTVDGAGRIVMSTTASGETRKTAGAQVNYNNDSDRVVSSNLDNFTPSIDNMRKDARRDGFSARIAANKTFSDIVQHGSSHYHKYGTYADTADMLSNSVNQNVTSTISNDRSLQQSLRTSVDKGVHAEVGIPQMVTKIVGAGAGYSVSWKDSSGKDFTSTLKGSDAEAFSTAYNHGISNTLKTASADEKTSQDVHNLLSSVGLSNESAELHSIDSEQALSESQRTNLTGAFVEHEAQKPEFAAIADIKDRNQAAADYINYAAVHDPQAISKDFGAFVQKYDSLKPADTASLKAKAEKDISTVQNQEQAAAHTLKKSGTSADAADKGSLATPPTAQLVKPDADGHQARRDATNDQINEGSRKIAGGEATTDKGGDIPQNTR